MRPLTVRNLAHAISTAHVYKIPWKYQAFHTLTSSDINKNKNSPKATMTRVLLTGGSGFIAAHVLDILLQHGHSVVTTVRSQEKADKIKQAHSSYGSDKLDFAIVEDIAQENAFDKAVVSDPPFEAVIHTAR
jgi:NADPH:quinone reductase-like Zn-dependent oxidoreductase